MAYANDKDIKPYQFKPGQSGNPKGKPKGAKDWSIVVRNLLEDEKFFERVMEKQKKPEWLDGLPIKNGSHAIAAAMLIKALGGNKKAADWLRKTGFGEKLIHNFEAGMFAEGKMEVTVVKADRELNAEANTERQTTDGNSDT